MEYRQIGEQKVSLLGFGCMRFPTENGKIDAEKAEVMLDKARLAGVNYFDTAYPYHDMQSEPFVGEYLSKLPRESYYLATKLPCWEINTLEDAKAMFTKQLDRLGKDYVDFYLLHALDRSRWEKMESLGVYKYLLEMKAQGKIKNLGFSFHDDYNAFELIARARKWDFCQIQLNYMDIDEQAGMKGYRLTEELGIPLVIMEPIKGGSLANLPDEVTAGFTEVSPDRSAASWALRWVGTLPNVKVILSGMTTIEQVEDNLKTFGDFKPLSDKEQETIKKASDILASRINNGCTGCNYCMPCPAGVNIPSNFRIWNQYGIYENNNSTVWQWKNEIGDEQKAKNCISCGKCETVCPQHLSIRENLERLQKELDMLDYS